MNYYYLDSARNTIGPISAGLMMGMHQSGLLTNETMVIRDGGQDWASFSEVFGVPTTAQAGSKGKKTVPIVIISGVLLSVALAGWWMTTLRQPVPEVTAGTKKNRVVEKTPTLTSVEGAESRPVLIPVSLPPIPEVKTVEVEPQMENRMSMLAAAGKSSVQEHPLGEWYEFGYRQAMAAKPALRSAGEERASLSQLTEQMKRLGAESDTFPAEVLGVCYQGYRDGFESRGVAYGIPKQQASSLLPPMLRAHSRFAHTMNEEPADGLTPLERAIQATTMIQIGREKGTSHGTGFFIAPGVMVTNRHVVEGARWIKVRTVDRVEHVGIFMGALPDRDIAMVKIQARNYPILKLGRADRAHVGDEITAIGYPKESVFSATTTFGRISSTDRNFSDVGDNFQIDLSINPGNSGGPLINEEFQVIGVNTWKLNGVDRFNFALKINEAFSLIRQTYPSLVLPQ